MPLCNKYNELSHYEKIIFIGQLVHCVQSDDVIFDMANDLINLAQVKGVMDGIKILPEDNQRLTDEA